MSGLLWFFAGAIVGAGAFLLVGLCVAAGAGDHAGDVE